MQFENLDEPFKIGINDFKDFIKDDLCKYKNENNLKSLLVYFLFRQHKLELYWKYISDPSDESLKEIDQNQLYFIFDLAKKENYWLENSK